MLKDPLYPLLLQPSLHVKVWGGRKLETLLHKELPTDDPYGEAWELHDTATVRNGELAGKTLGELLQVYGRELIGVNNNPDDGFPLLAKILDSNDWLSVQVHPNDEQARKLEGDPRGKTEAWIVMAAEPNSRLVIGVKEGTTRDEMIAAIEDNRLEDLIVYRDVTVGDVLFVNANTIHALGPGLLIYEIQQSSNITYRLYDWGRMGLDGQPRELHIEKGVAVANLESLPTIQHIDAQGPVTEVIRSPFFNTDLYHLEDHEIIIQTHGHFHALTCVEGSANISTFEGSVDIELGQTVLVAATLTEYALHGRGKLFCSYQ